MAQEATIPSSLKTSVLFWVLTQEEQSAPCFIWQKSHYSQHINKHQGVDVRKEAYVIVLFFPKSDFYRHNLCPSNFTPSYILNRHPYVHQKHVQDNNSSSIHSSPEMETTHMSIIGMNKLWYIHIKE